MFIGRKEQRKAGVVSLTWVQRVSVRNFAARSIRLVMGKHRGASSMHRKSFSVPHDRQPALSQVKAEIRDSSTALLV